MKAVPHVSACAACASSCGLLMPLTTAGASACTDWSSSTWTCSRQAGGQPGPGQQQQHSSSKEKQSVFLTRWAQLWSSWTPLVFFLYVHTCASATVVAATPFVCRCSNSVLAAHAMCVASSILTIQLLAQKLHVGLRPGAALLLLLLVVLVVNLLLVCGMEFHASACNAAAVG